MSPLRNSVTLVRLEPRAPLAGLANLVLFHFMSRVVLRPLSLPLHGFLDVITRCIILKQRGRSRGRATDLGFSFSSCEDSNSLFVVCRVLLVGGEGPPPSASGRGQLSAVRPVQTGPSSPLLPPLLSRLFCSRVWTDTDLACRVRCSCPLFLSRICSRGGNLTRACACLESCGVPRRRAVASGEAVVVFHFYLFRFGTLPCVSDSPLPSLPSFSSFSLLHAHTWNGLDDGQSVEPALKWACPSERD